MNLSGNRMEKTSHGKKLRRSGLYELIPVLLLTFLLAAIGPLPSRVVAVSNDASREEEPVRPIIEMDLVYRYISAGWLDFAAVELSDLVEAAPADVEAKLIMAMSFDALGEADEAEKLYLDIIENSSIDSIQVSALVLLGRLYLREGMLDQAEAVLHKAEAIDDQSAWVGFALGQVAERRGDEDGAVSWYSMASERAEEWIEPIVYLASIYNQTNEFITSVELLHQYAALGSRHAEFHYQLALSYIGLIAMIDSGSLSEEDIDVLRELDVYDDGSTERLRDLAHHAIDRVLQLAPEHAGALQSSQLIP